MGFTEGIGWNIMKNTVEIFGMSLVATVLFVVAHFVLRPAPVPALSGLAGGLVDYSRLGDLRPRYVLIGESDYRELAHETGFSICTLFGDYDRSRLP
jgi:hypothetical protein